MSLRLDMPGLGDLAGYELLMGYDEGFVGS
jgi:hypothetical protein